MQISSSSSSAAHERNELAARSFRDAAFAEPCVVSLNLSRTPARVNITNVIQADP